jgi:hypothetical protein
MNPTDDATKRDASATETDSSLNLRYSYDVNLESAYVITLEGNELSEKLAARCMDSCRQNDVPVKKWAAFDGTSGKIITPNHLKNKDYIKWFKVLDPYLSPSEIACALSHISLWAHCIEMDKPIAILEHDTIVMQNMKVHTVSGCIVYLGCIEQSRGGWDVRPTPPHGTYGHNYHFICRAHAYTIDPIIAKNLLAYVLKHGICESLDLMLRADLFPIVQTHLIAYDMPDKTTTITGRKKTPFGSER